MPYPENFVVRLIVCIVGMLVIWIGVRFIMDVLIFHDPFEIKIDFNKSSFSPSGKFSSVALL